MADERQCLVCGRPHGRSSRVCADCAAAYGPERLSPPMLDISVTSAEGRSSGHTGIAEESGVAEPPVRGVPLPPQLRTPAGAQPTGPASVARSVQPTCPSCRAVVSGGFSFCSNCGADLPGVLSSRWGVSSSANIQPVGAGEPADSVGSERVLPPGVRDPREGVRRITQAYDDAIGAAAGQRQAQKPLSSETAEGEVEEAVARPVSPFAHAVLSFFFPGVGQILNGQPAKGFLLIVAGFVSVVAFGWGPWNIPILVARFLVAIDAYRIANRRLAGESIEPTEWDLT